MYKCVGMCACSLVSANLVLLRNLRIFLSLLPVPSAAFPAASSFTWPSAHSA